MQASETYLTPDPPAQRFTPSDNGQNVTPGASPDGTVPSGAVARIMWPIIVAAVGLAITGAAYESRY